MLALLSAAAALGSVLFQLKKKKKKKDKDVIRVYMDGCFDLMHFGHANALRQARAIASQINDTKKCELIVGLVSDEEILRCKGPPVLPEAERVKCVKAVKWVDDVITNVPYELLPEFVEELFSGASLLFMILSIFFPSVCLNLLKLTRSLASSYYREIRHRLYRARRRPVLLTGRDGRVRDTEEVRQVSGD
jgi:cytidyltransferase-like protein